MAHHLGACDQHVGPRNYTQNSAHLPRAHSNPKLNGSKYFCGTYLDPKVRGTEPPQRLRIPCTPSSYALLKVRTLNYTDVMEKANLPQLLGPGAAR